MDDKNELNDLLLGNQKESSSSKKFFLIAAGVLLLFFIIIGIMKFMGSSETKQPLPITSTEQPKKLPEPMAEHGATVALDTNGTKGVDSNTATVGEEKLDAIVKKLQQEAQTQASMQSAPSTTQAPTPAQVGQPAQQSVVKPMAQSDAKPVPVAPVAIEQKKVEPQPQTTNVVTVPIKTAAPQGALVQKPKESPKKEDVKTAFKEATKNVAKSQPKQQTQAQKQQHTKEGGAAKPAAQSAGAYFVQVGYFDSEASAKTLREKVNSLGFGSTTRAAVKNDKNITKVWVGPFDSKEDAAKALPKIREQIKNDAFITKE